MSNKKKMVVAKEVHNKTQAEEMSRHKTATLNVWKINLFFVFVFVVISVCKTAKQIVINVVY